jgi:hypothetical protein
MGKTKKRKYEPKPKVIKVSGYFNKEELQLVKFVANNLLKVSETQFVKGAAVEMAQATLKMAQEKQDAEQAQAAEKTDVSSGTEEQADSSGETVGETVDDAESTNTDGDS